MLKSIIRFSVRNKLIIILFTLTIIGFGIYTVLHIPVGAVPDITNNQVQVITTSGNLSTQEIEQFITAPVEMEMANLPGVKEIRSISKYGISVVTVVFNESMGTYLPRQLIAEKIKSASALIPEGYGSPEMGPISTGLGEIYQYVLSVRPGFEDKYDATELRTIQDWIVKRRLAGIPGVVEINSWGGYLKQYEVALDPEKLKASGIDLLSVFNALDRNNDISGAAYIEKQSQSYFIRGDGMATSLDDIGNIVVSNQDGVPVLLKDIAAIRFGHANRFGAITANGQGETVLGQIMMLKNANSKEVISEVKARVAEIQENLPEGVYINPILERSELIDKTSFTVVENLILGALIVMLTVILLLGNLRSALVIASMIPLTLLFTVSMMYVFGIDANLMSLGALDFGIIIDGAVIIVEYIALRLGVWDDRMLSMDTSGRRSEFDQIAVKGSSRMMQSAIFGQVIILIVFIPILSLSGVEGKMFRPMALSFSFAIIGAMILGMTWLPVASALFLRPVSGNRKGISERIMGLAYHSYTPVLEWSCRNKRTVLGTAFGALAGTALLFSSMGGEFVPTLDEGDFVIQPVLKTGTSLSKTVELTTRMENILIDSFPSEVEQIVSRIGAAEVPTDPMSMEEIDMIIKLKPKKMWERASSKDELAALFRDALSQIPGVEYEFTQPIEMRFNELITGVRSDIAVKVFGEDLDYINSKAAEIKGLIDGVPGAADVILEKTEGLPQIRVRYDRSRIAFYGADIASLNEFLAAGFGGRSSGVIFEGEKRFDLVIRLDKRNRTDIEDIRQLPVPVQGGIQIPLSELADISYTEGPAKISRENTQRRVVVSVNVMNRDLESVVGDIRRIVDEKVKLEPGNHIEYGGQFENLENASRRLMLAVPLAFVLIFIFLHFAFRSFKDAIMIFTAIPLSTVGGVLLLWLRGMPFSVSAGVGFIALFGIAVLNGIVLIEHLKDLRAKGNYDMRELILKGTRDRLRPVLLTAAAAAMGFLPMAISTGAGAEVQRPLATVVIGGLISSTLLTMIALPLLFEIFYQARKPRLKIKGIKGKSALLILLASPFLTQAQGDLKASSAQATRHLTLEQAIELAMTGNAEIKAMGYDSMGLVMSARSAFKPGKTAITYGSDQNNIAENGYPLRVIGIEQQFEFPAVYPIRKQYLNSTLLANNWELALNRNRIAAEVAKQFFNYQTLANQLIVYQQLDSLYTLMEKAARTKLLNGDFNSLQVMEISMHREQAVLKRLEVERELKLARSRIGVLINCQCDFELIPELVRHHLPTDSSNARIMSNLLSARAESANAATRLVRMSAMPDISLNYFAGTNNMDNAQVYHGFQVGVAVPLAFRPYRAEVQSAEYQRNAQLERLDFAKAENQLEIAGLALGRDAYAARLDNYESSGRQLEEEIMRSALLNYESGNIDFMRFASLYESALQMRLDYIRNLGSYNSYAYELYYINQ